MHHRAPRRRESALRLDAFGRELEGLGRRIRRVDGERFRARFAQLQHRRARLVRALRASAHGTRDAFEALRRDARRARGALRLLDAEVRDARRRVG